MLKISTVGWLSNRWSTKKKVSAVYADLTQADEPCYLGQIAIENNGLINITFPDRTMWSGNMDKLRMAVSVQATNEFFNSREEMLKEAGIMRKGEPGFIS